MTAAFQRVLLMTILFNVYICEKYQLDMGHAPTISFLAAWGLLMYCGMKWQAINLASAFLLLGVGIDDAFVMLSAWNRHGNGNHIVNYIPNRKWYKYYINIVPNNIPKRMAGT